MFPGQSYDAQSSQRVLIDFADALAGFIGIALDKVLDQYRNVVLAFLQGGT